MTPDDRTPRRRRRRRRRPSAFPANPNRPNGAAQPQEAGGRSELPQQGRPQPGQGRRRRSRRRGKRPEGGAPSDSAAPEIPTSTEPIPLTGVLFIKPNGAGTLV